MGGRIPKPFTKGDKIGRLTALGESESRIVGQHRGVYEKCVCDCGTVKRILRNHLRQGKIKSCGCLARETSRNTMIKMNTKHGMFGTRFYKIYYGINTRCNNENYPKYYMYGGRGIKCEWRTFEEFQNDMYASYKEHVEEYGEQNTTIDRINNDGNYCKENCRRATIKEQGNNRRNNKILIYKGKEYTQQQLGECVGLPTYIVGGRLKRGWSVERTIETPILTCYSNKKFTS